MIKENKTTANLEEEKIELLESIFTEGEQLTLNNFNITINKVISQTSVEVIYKCADINNKEKNMLLKEREISFAENFKRRKEVLQQTKLPFFPIIYDCMEYKNRILLLQTEEIGKPLIQVVTELTPIQFCKYIIQSAQALKSIHKLGYSNLQITPETILITGDKKIMLTGWEFLSKIGEVLQNPKYIPSWSAPECRENVNVDKTMDIYSLGAIMYWYVTGKEIQIGEECFAVSNVNKPGWLQIISTMICSKENRLKDMDEVIKQLLLLLNEIEPRFNLEVGYATTVGLEPSRTTNEDSCAFSQKTIVLQSKSTNFGIFIVADGMGGQDAGEVASKIAISTVIRDFENYIFSIDAIPTSQEQNSFLVKTITHANEEIVNYNKRTNTDAGTTITCAFIINNKLAIGHVGDSRAYLIDKNEVTKLTIDHSLVEILVRTGQITKEEAKIHPDKNKILKCLGLTKNLSSGYVDTLTTSVNMESYELKDGNIILLCSDGLWGCVEDEDIKKICWKLDNPTEICKSLIEQVIKNGAPDNATVIVVKVSNSTYENSKHIEQNNIKSNKSEEKANI